MVTEAVTKRRQADRAKPVPYDEAVRLAGGQGLLEQKHARSTVANWRSYNQVPAGVVFWKVAARIKGGALRLPQGDEEVDDICDRVRRLANRTRKRGKEWGSVVNVIRGLVPDGR